MHTNTRTQMRVHHRPRRSISSGVQQNLKSIKPKVGQQQNLAGCVSACLSWTNQLLAPPHVVGLFTTSASKKEEKKHKTPLVLLQNPGAEF